MAKQHPGYPLAASIQASFKATLAATFLLSTSVGMSPAIATLETPKSVGSTLTTAVDPTPLLAQATAGSILYFDTATYTVHVFREGNRTLMNVYDQSNRILRQNRGATSFTIENSRSTFVSEGSYSGNAATYKASVATNDQLRLQIVDGSGRVIADQVGVGGDAIVNLAPEQRPQAARETVLAFETTSYAVRVFRREANYFMNVYNKFSGVSEQNGAAANLARPEPPYEQAVSYVSGGARNDLPVRYFARIDSTGQTMLEIYNINGLRIFQEPGDGPVTINIPQGDLPIGVGNLNNVASAYVAAVFGDERTLTEVQKIYPGAFMDSSSLGRFINAGAFPNRDTATARVLDLRGRGFNARLVYRDVRYR